MADRTQFLILLRPSRDSFPGDATAEELAVIGEHFQDMKRATDAGDAILVGRTQDEHPLGLAVIEADDLAAARVVSWSRIPRCWPGSSGPSCVRTRSRSCDRDEGRPDADRRERAGLAGLAGEAPRAGRRDLAGLLQEGQRQGAHPLRRRGRRGAVLRLDRQHQQAPRRALVGAALSPRRKGSPCSEMNKARARRLIAEGRMTAAGLAALDHELDLHEPRRLVLAPDVRACPGRRSADLEALPRLPRGLPAHPHRLDRRRAPPPGHLREATGLLRQDPPAKDRRFGMIHG